MSEDKSNVAIDSAISENARIEFLKIKKILF
jgi:hypothetical protein